MFCIIFQNIICSEGVYQSENDIKMSFGLLGSLCYQSEITYLNTIIHVQCSIKLFRFYGDSKD